MVTINRRRLLQLAGARTGLSALGLPLFGAAGWAQGRDSITIAFPTDVPTWDPNARVLAGVQSLYKCVFDSPLTQAPDLSAQPNLVKAWRYRDAAALELEIELRDDAVFHNGDKVTAEDFAYSFDTRPKAPVPEGGRKLDTSFIWRKVRSIEVLSPTRAVMHFTEPIPSAVTWLYFLASFVVPKAYIEKVGTDGFIAKPIGSGPYRLAEYQQNARIVLEGFERYWGGTPKLKRVIIEIVQDPSARVAALDARRVDLAVDLPIREIARLSKTPGLVGRIDPISDILIIEVNHTGAFENEEVRLAAHRAIDKQAISKAFYAGKAIPIDVPAARNTPGYPPGFAFPHDETKAKALLAKAGFSAKTPARITFFTSKGVFPNDFEVAQAIAAMWKKVGIEASLEVMEMVKYQELLRAGKLPEATLYQWGNATGDPEMYGGYLLDPKSIFSSYKSDDLGQRTSKLLVETDADKRTAGYRELHGYAVQKGYSIPLFQGTKTVAYQSALDFKPYANGWMLPQTYALKG
jgi:peptide/nickel transport system substrate-binding protein